MKVDSLLKELTGEQRLAETSTFDPRGARTGRN
jgi:hypothetical protein